MFSRSRSARNDITLRRSTWVAQTVTIAFGVSGLVIAIYFGLRGSPAPVVSWPRFVSGPLAASDVRVGYGPVRRIYVWRKDMRVRTVTFNSITGVPNVGDERSFCDVKSKGATKPGGFQNTVYVTPGTEWLVRAIVDNDADPDVSPAIRTRASMTWTSPGVRVVLTCTITADNADPPGVADTVVFQSLAGRVSIGVVPGSAALYNMAHPSGLPLPDALVSPNGTALGYEKLNGVMPGSFDHAGLVTVLVKVSAGA